MIDNKLCKTAKTLDTIIKVIQVIAAIGIVVALIVGVAMVVALALDVPTELIGEPDFTLTLDSYKLTLSEDVPLVLEKAIIISIPEAFITAAHMGIIYYFFKVLRAIFAPMKEGKPFHNSVSLNLKKLGYCGIAMCVMDAFHGIFGAIEATMIYPLQEMLGESVTYVEHTVEINMGYLLLAGVCFLLSYVFHYGTQLQIQSDETL